MKRFYLSLGLLTCSMVSFAQLEPNVKPEVPIDGHQYVLVNEFQNSEQYTSRTSWDGALYFLGKDNSHYADYAFTAVKNSDGTWSFTLPCTIEVETGEFDDGGNPIKETVDATSYMALPNGSPNVNFVPNNVATWYLAAKENNYYQLVLKDGHNPSAMSVAQYTPTGDLRVHLNNNRDFFVVTYLDGPYYKDCYGGITETVDEMTGDIYFSANDSVSFQWGFVSVENIPEFMGDFKAYRALKDYEMEYLGEGYEDYLEGFTASYNAALAIYKSSDYIWEEDAAIVVETLKKKETFYNTIEEALLLEDPTPTLTAAINNAIESFKTVASVSEVESAIETLQSAIQAFKEGTGDYTSMGKNMSFEDLSSQGGGETSGVADVPTGWNMYINGVQVYTADEVRSNGINAWCGINSDSEGEGKDGNESFGIWTSGIPAFELSQSIEGLDNGTYIITAGLMAGANGNGSRLTTQRIFGNLNSAYYGEESMYDTEVLDQSELFTFASNPEVQTDRALYPVEVRAFVYDGTLTFGVRTDGNIAATFRTSGNGAGGDGWFKVDNFRIQKIGYVGEDAANVANHFINVIDKYVSEDIFAKSLEDEVSPYITSEVDPDTPESEIIAIITTLKDKIPAIKSSIDAYKDLWKAIDDGLTVLEDYAYAPSAETVLSPAISDGQEAYDERNVDESQIKDLIDAIEKAILVVKSEAVQEGEYANVIANGSFENLSSQNNRNSDGVENPPAGWSLVFNGTECTSKSEYGSAGANLGWCAINGGDNINATDLEGNLWNHQYTDGEHVWGIWAGNIPDVELYQVIKGLPAGTYTLSCDMVVEWNWGGQCLTTQRIFANRYVKMFGTEDLYTTIDEETSEVVLKSTLATPDMETALACDSEYPEAEYPHLGYAGYSQTQSYNETSCPRHIELTFGLLDGEDLKIGFRTNNVDAIQETPHPYDSAGWFKLDNFQLLYESATVPEGADATTIRTIEGNGVGVVGQKYYTLSGAAISHPQRGINIVKTIMSDGSVKTSKIFVR